MTLPGVGTPEPSESPAEALSASEVHEYRTIVLPGKPMAMTRPRFNRSTGFVYRDDVRASRKGDFAQAWLDAGLDCFERGVPLEAEIEFVFDRPSTHFGTGRNAGELKERFRFARPAGGKNGGDFDNLAKLVTDGLEGVAYHNDSQLAEVRITKRYSMPGEPPTSRISVRALLPPPASSDL